MSQTHLISLCALLAIDANVNGFDGRTVFYGPCTVVLTYPVVVRPAVWNCSPILVPLAPQRSMPYAQPSAAPPSTDVSPRSRSPGESNEPTLGSKTAQGPTITESRAEPPASTGPPREKCKVGFWNVSGRNITLTIDGQKRVLPRNRAITLDLARDFSWQVDEGAPANEHVSADENFHELIIRQ
jgi:hypothetical protein